MSENIVIEKSAHIIRRIQTGPRTELVVSRIARNKGDVIDVRTFLQIDGSMRPTKSGVRFDIGLSGTLVSAIQQAASTQHDEAA